MIPILYDSNEMSFTSNGLGRLRDTISCRCTEERNGIFECDFEYPVNGQNYDRILLGRTIAAKYDDSEDIQPFDIVSNTEPINGIVKYHAVHISYRQSKLTAFGTGINSLRLTHLTFLEKSLHVLGRYLIEVNGVMKHLDRKRLIDDMGMVDSRVLHIHPYLFACELLSQIPHDGVAVHIHT